MKKSLLVFTSIFSFFLPSFLIAGGGGTEDPSVNLIHAEGKIFYHDVLIQWSTELEKNQFEFLIERSKDNKEWFIRGKVKANGPSTKHSEYSYKDVRDDQYKFYRIRSIEAGGMKMLKEFELENYSINVNLTNVIVANAKRLVIDYSIDQDQEILLRIYNKIGEQVETRLMPFNTAGNYIFHLDINHLKPGNYLLVVTQTLLDKSVAEKQFTVEK